MNDDQYRRFKALWFLRVLLAGAVVGFTYNNPMSFWLYVVAALAVAIVSNVWVNIYIEETAPKQVVQNDGSFNG